jgi:hypothetical protein
MQRICGKCKAAHSCAVQASSLRTIRCFEVTTLLFKPYAMLLQLAAP